MDRLDKCLYALEKGFNYNKKTGVVTTPNNKEVVKKTNKYISLCLYKNKKRYYLYAHHFAWYFENREIVGLIDHKNQVKTDNRISNLRATTKQVNALNTNSSGAYLDKRSNRYESLVMVDGKRIYLGKFDTKEEAENTHKNYKLNKIKELCK